MRSRLLVALPLLLALGSVPVASAASRMAPAATVKVFVAPVTSNGQPSAGFNHVSKESYAIDCSFKDPSPGAVSPNIEECSPSAAYAIACWNAATAQHVLCMQDPSSHKLVQFKRMGRFANTPIAKSRDQAPLLLILADGSRCQIRDGGAWGQPKGHPNLYGAYSCDKHGVAWLYAKGSYTEPHNGVDESSPVWRIRTGETTVVWRNIATAYFVATAS